MDTDDHRLIREGFPLGLLIGTGMGVVAGALCVYAWMSPPPPVIEPEGAWTLRDQVKLTEIWRTVADSNAKLVHANMLRAETAEQQRDLLLLIVERCDCGEAKP